MAQPSLSSVVAHDFAFAAQQLGTTATQLSPGSYPALTNTSGGWETTGASGWTSGFLAGSLWLMYQRTGDPIWRERAQTWQAGLKSQQSNTSTHDLGFMLFNSFGNGYRLTSDDAYRQVVLKAAASLATRYNPTVGCIKSWDAGPTDFKVIIDNMLNLELLFWASKHGGQSAWYDVAVSHALKTRAQHVRPDGSTYHVVNFDPATGAVKQRGTAQGYSDESTWARGQAWAIYGFTMVYRETGDPRFLETARVTADYFLAHLPADHVPYWDFQAPGIPTEPRDSSAAAIAASGLLELSQLEGEPSRQLHYRAAASDILESLSSLAYLAQGTTNQAILLHGTRNKPKGSFDTGLIWGDYYLLEALLRFTSVNSALGTLTGRVTDRTTGAGIQGALLAYSGGGNTTDHDGQYRLAELASGSYTLTITASGYLSATRELSVAAGMTTTADVELMPLERPQALSFTALLPLITRN